MIPEVGLVPEAKPRDTNNQVVLFSLSILDREHILMARSVAEGPNIKTNLFLILKIGL